MWRKLWSAVCIDLCMLIVMATCWLNSLPRLYGVTRQSYCPFSHNPILCINNSGLCFTLHLLESFIVSPWRLGYSGKQIKLPWWRTPDQILMLRSRVFNLINRNKVTKVLFIFLKRNCDAIVSSVSFTTL